MMRRWFCAALLAAAGAAQAEDSFSVTVREQVESRPAGTLQRQDAELRWQYSAVRGVLSARDGHGLYVNELAYEGALGGGFVTAGKKVMSWDVGYAFRPLDVVQQEDRRALDAFSLDGVKMLAWESFGADSAVTLAWVNPGHGRAGQPRSDEALAMRLYRQRGSRDEYAVLRLSRRNGVEAGASFSHVASDGLELHGSLLWQQRGSGSGAGNVGGTGNIDGYGSGSRGGRGKALAGFTWTTESKFSLIGEAWEDRSALPGQQRNVLLRASHNEGELELSADLLWQPQTGSRIGTAGASWKRGPRLLRASYRHFGGLAGRYAPHVAIASVQYAF